LLAQALNDMSQGLAERETLREERTKMERDLAVARQIQMNVLPKSIPPCPGYDLAAYSLPAEQTGGDIYDLVALTLEDADAMDREGCSGDAPPADPTVPRPLVVLLADAAGHGIGSALSVTQVRSMLRIGVRLRAGLSAVFDQINRQLCDDLGAERFVTAFLGVLDPAGHCVNYRSAGQAPLLHYRAVDGRLTWLDSSMMPLGIDEDPPDDGVQRLLLEPSDLFVLLTDGFYEYTNPDRQHFGRAGVGEVITRCHNLPAKEILAELLTATRVFGDGAPQLDDMTALIIKRHPAAHPPDAGAAPADRSSAIGAPTLEIRLPRDFKAAAPPRVPAPAPAPAMT
jgi:phosphoserine phosphatase